MNKMLVAVFDSESAAFQGLSALKDLHQSGDISLYATAVISRNEKGELKLKSAADRGPVGTATGVLAGSLIGLMGGPVGMAIGAASGYLAGLLYDVGSGGGNFQFLEEVSTALTKGKTAIVAEIDESWTVPVDTKLEDALVFRRLRDEVLEDQLARESKAIAAEYEKLEEELIEAGEERKAQIRSALGKLREKAHAVNDQVNRKLKDTSSELDAKVNAIKEQMRDIKERRREKMEKRLDELKADYSERTEKLKKARKLISEAIAPKEESPV
jgi:uncharacterized membrane protein